MTKASKKVRIAINGNQKKSELPLMVLAGLAGPRLKSRLKK